MGGVQGDMLSWRDIDRDRASRSGVNKGSASTRASKSKNKGLRSWESDAFHRHSKVGRDISIFYDIYLSNDLEFLSLVVLCDKLFRS